MLPFHPRAPRLQAILAVFVGFSGTAVAQKPEPVVSTFVDGSVKSRYEIDSKGRRHGAYARFHRNGQAKIRATYRAGQLHGAYYEYYRSGKHKVRASYKDGQLHGESKRFSADGKRVVIARYKLGVKHGLYTVMQGKKVLTRQEWTDGTLTTLDGITPFPVPLTTIQTTLPKILKAPEQVPGADADPLLPRRLEALRRLQAYRFLCRLRYADMELKPEWNTLCDFGAQLCKRIGRLDHTPQRPSGMDEESYRKGYRATSHSNLSAGSGMVRSVDAYMNDSDAKNIGAVGHRRWCLNPTMKFTGFGEAGRYSAMWSFDKSGSGAKDLEAVFYPPQGHVPVGYFGPRHAWSIQMLRGRPKADTAKIEIVPLDGEFLPAGAPLELDHLGVTGNCLIFRPVGIQVRPGQTYRCEVSLDGGASVRFRYLVQFVANPDGA